MSTRKAAARALAALATFLLVIASAHGQSGQPILTEGFEGNFQSDPSCKQGVCNVPAGWGVWFIPRTENDLPGVNFQPQADRTTARVRSGAAAQRLWTDNATFTGGIYRVVNDVQVGARLRFTIWGQVWSTNDESPISARPSRDIRVKVGVDPLGGDNGRPSPLNGQVIWSPEQEAKDEFIQFTVEVDARSPTVILYTYTTMRDNVRHNEVFWDDAVLEYVAPPPTATPDPASAPATPTAAPEGATAPASAAQPAAPVAVPPVTYTVKAGDTLLGIALDQNVPLAELLKNNPGVKPEALQIGQVLIIKPGTTAAEAATAAATPAPEAAAGQAQGEVNASSPAVEATPTVGQACVQAFFDDDGDGKRDDLEDLVPNIQFVLTTGGNVIGTYTTNGVDEPYCFENLPNQAYTIAGTPLDIYVPTTPLNDTLQVNGARSYFSLGLRRVSDGFEDISPTPTPRPPLVAIDDNLAVGLLSLGGGALLLIGTVGFIISAALRRRRL
ncbi:MAG: LysM domain-containing protein [Anaerolineae bacterium]|nr:LysM peptidoglycan-binding domain-containing protein [Candidatus Roseilinea sp.]MDW8450408.1 LysM domain-containing protein [Anaerolineae bacterium]